MVNAVVSVEWEEMHSSHTVHVQYGVEQIKKKKNSSRLLEQYTERTVFHVVNQ